MTEEADDILKRLPARLREARRAQGLSLEAVARLSGVSRSMVSQIERGESSPTIATLWNLTRALQVDFAGLLDVAPAGPQIAIIRAGSAPTIDNRGQHCRLRILSPPEDAGQHEVYSLDFAHGGALVSDPHRRGAQEHLTVVEGQVSITSAGQSERLGPGDTARYAADVPHAIRAEDGPARAFLIVRDA
ncbi:helix-turn-helix domain-containing protein [Cognatishimia sp. F0-27]|uniref:helix-turn-helix domain-containing protein n=1 Tax=Cognatishimia sp. F0-27 TaxID=2816855 RepID=UPI001D0C0C40|nr:XRE family transcriptional regulator [Cognatishimia sp. F0-27]MCC1491234.1 helix-turn-helix transcriptional regulator [Cognatishimia sp. F0-27]